MVQTGALSPKEGQLVSPQGWSCLGPPQASLAPSAGDERARRELVLLASVRVTSRQGVEIRGEKGPGVSCCLGLLWAQRGAHNTVLGERP